MTVPSYTVSGPATGPGVLLVHGLGVSGRYFRPLADLLATSFRVVVPDLPGFGASAHVRPSLDIPGQAEAMQQILERMDLDQPLLLGHSMGAQVVTEMAVRRPRHARRVVLVGPVVDPAIPTALDQGWRLARDAAFEPLPLKALTTAGPTSCPGAGTWRTRRTPACWRTSSAGSGRRTPPPSRRRTPRVTGYEHHAT